MHKIAAGFYAFTLLVKDTHLDGHYSFSYLLTCEVYLIEVLEIMAQIWQYIIFSSLKPIKVSSDFILNVLVKSCRGRHHSEISKTNAKTLIFPIWIHPEGPLNTPFEVWCAKTRTS